MQKSKVYALCDAQGRVVRIEGGYTTGNIEDVTAWTQIDEGFGDRYNLCQSHYLDKPLMDERGVYQYKLVDGALVERSAEEMDADAQVQAQEQEHQSAEERIAALEEALRMLLEGVTE